MSGRPSKVPLVDRLMSKVSPEPNSGCWLWMSFISPDGYARSQVVKGKHFLVHRTIFELFKGPIAQGLQLDHLCRVRCCVNPAHLEAVTLQENIKRGDTGKVNRSKTHCLRDHPFDTANTDYRDGKRHCRECERARHQKRYREKVCHASFS